MAEYDPYSMPRGIRLALVVTWLQTALNLLGGIYVVLGAIDLADHGRDGSGYIMIIGVLVLALAITLGVSSFFAGGGFAWSRVVILVFESLAAIGTLVQFLTTLDPFAAIGFGLAVLVIGQFLSRPARQWFVA